MNTAPSNHSVPHWLAIVAIWGGIGVCGGTPNLVSMKAMGVAHAAVELVVSRLLDGVPWALATPLVMRAGARHPLSAPHAGLARSLVRHVALWLAVSVVANLWSAGLESLLNPWNPMRPPMPVWTLF